MGDCSRGKKYDLKSTVPMKMEYEIRRRITKMRESEAFLYILGCLCVCVCNIEIAKESLCFSLYYDTLSLSLNSL